MPGPDPVAQLKTRLVAYRRANGPLPAVDAAYRLRQAAEELELHAIKAARDSGATWAEIGRCYGLSKQGAQQRFRANLAGQPDSGPGGRKHRKSHGSAAGPGAAR